MSTKPVEKYANSAGFEFDIETSPANVKNGEAKWGFLFKVRETTGKSNKPGNETFLVTFDKVRFPTRDAAEAFLRQAPMIRLQTRYLDQFPNDTMLPMNPDDLPIDDEPTFFEREGWAMSRGSRPFPA